MLARLANYKQEKRGTFIPLSAGDSPFPFLSNVCISGTTTSSHYTGGTTMLFASKLIDLAYNKLPARSVNSSARQTATL